MILVRTVLHVQAAGFRLLSGAVVLMLSACGQPAGSPSDATVASATSVAAAPEATAVASPTRSSAVEVDGNTLYAQCAGTGSPTVVFLHGVGGDASDWSRTVSELSGISTCIYDRVNVGRSSRDPERHTATDSVEELHKVLDALDVEPPYILVGHSIAGEIALMYGGTYPDEVSGVLLVDATLPFEAELFPPEMKDDVREEMNANGEHLDAYEAFAETAALLDTLPDVPITYMLATRGLEQLPSEWPAGAYKKSLQSFMHDLPQGRIAEYDASHRMPREIPSDIAAEVRQMLKESN